MNRYRFILPGLSFLVTSIKSAQTSILTKIWGFGYLPIYYKIYPPLDTYQKTGDGITSVHIDAVRTGESVVLYLLGIVFWFIIGYAIDIILRKFNNKIPTT